jgi:hypothetical protein
MEPFTEFLPTAEAAIGPDAIEGVSKRVEGAISSGEIAIVLGPGWRVEYYETSIGTKWTLFTNGK